MAEIKTAGAGGLNTAINPLIAQADGLYRLSNMWVDQQGWASKRRGFKQLNTSSTWTSVMSGSGFVAKDIWFYDDHLFVYGEGNNTTGIAAYDFVTNAGWHKVVETAANATAIGNDSTLFYGLRSCAVDRRQLLNTALGVKRIAAIYDDFYPKGSTTSVNYSTMYRDAGVPRALDPRCRNAVAGGGTDHGLFAITGFEWLLLSSAVAYRVAWFKRDENGIPNISMPSGRIVIRNESTTTNYAVRLKVPIPAGVTDSTYVLQIYRTNIISMDGTGVIPDPGDEMFLAGEYKLTSTDLSNKYVLYEDVSFDTLLGADLYSNESQDGPTQVRCQPPLARDIAYFGGCAFYANVTERQRLTIKILAVDSSGIGTFKGIRVGDAIQVGDLVMVGSTTANEEVNAWNFAVDGTTGVGSEVIRCIKTAESLAYKYNMWSNANNGRYAAYCMTTNNDIVGVVQLEEKGVGGSTGVYMSTSRVDSPVQILPNCQFTSSPGNTLAQACAVATDAGPTTVTLTYGANHNLTTGDLIFLAPFANSTTSGTSSPMTVNTHVPSGVYKVTVTGATTVTFPAPSGAASAANDARAAATGGYAHKIFDVAGSIWTEARSKTSKQINRLMWSSVGEPESAPPLNSVDLGDASKAILRIVPTIDSLFIFKEDGLWRLKGGSGDWEIIAFDAACVLAAAETPAIVDGRIYCYTTNGVMSIDDGGTRKVSEDVGGELDNKYRANATYPPLAINYRGCGHSEQNAYWLTFAASSLMYRYHVPTKSWSRHCVMPPNQKSDPAVGTQSSQFICTAKASRYTSFDNQAYAERLVIAHGGSGGQISIERRTSHPIDLCDHDIPVTVNSLDTVNNTVALASMPSNAEVGDLFMWYANAAYRPGGYSFSSASTIRATISAINGNVLTLNISGTVPAVSTWPAVSGAMSGSILKQIRSDIAYNPFLVDSGMGLGHFSEVLVSTGSCGRFSQITAGFNTETASAVPLTDQDTSTINGFGYADWTSMSDPGSESSMPYLRTFRTGVPRKTAFGSYLLVTLHHNRACELFDVAGLRLTLEQGSEKTRRTNA